MRSTATQGLKTKQRPDPRTPPWELVVIARMLGRYDQVPSTPATQAAESGLFKGAQNAYWFLSRVDNLYGRVLMIWDVADHLPPGWEVTHFDTGGVWHKFIEGDPPFTGAADMQRFVTANSNAGSLASANDHATWCALSFAHPYEYVGGISPPYARLDVRLETPKNATNALTWSWELRGPINDYSLPQARTPLSLLAIFISQQDLQQLRTYILHETPANARASLIKSLSAYVQVFPTLNEATQQGRKFVSSR